MRKLSQKQLGATGRLGEDAAADYLLSAGYIIEDRNAVFGKYEIDIVASNDRFVVFCEVKTRTAREDVRGRYGAPSAAVTAEKRRNLLSAARAYLKTYKKRRIPRMDVIEVTLTPGGEPEISHIRGAFRS